MKKSVLGLMLITVAILLSNCGNSGSENTSDDRTGRIKQLADGTLSLNVDRADCYSNSENPSGNTAEWSVIVSKSGSYNVWLTSLTKDTTNLNYENNVMVSIADNVLEAKPRFNRVVRNANDVSTPFFRADSYLGTVFIPDTGSYFVQVVSEKIQPKVKIREGLTGEDISRLVSVSFTPATR